MGRAPADIDSISKRCLQILHALFKHRLGGGGGDGVGGLERPLSPTRLPSEILNWPVSVSALFRLKIIPGGENTLYLSSTYLLNVSIQNKAAVFLCSLKQNYIIS